MTTLLRILRQVSEELRYSLSRILTKAAKINVERETFKGLNTKF